MAAVAVGHGPHTYPVDVGVGGVVATVVGTVTVTPSRLSRYVFPLPSGLMTPSDRSPEAAIPKRESVAGSP